jgi:hypothetical protein
MAGGQAGGPAHTRTMPLRRRWVVATALAGLIFTTSYAAAASLGVGASSLAAGAASVDACDPDGVTTSYAEPFYDGSGYDVGTITVAGIAADCVGRDFVVLLADASGTQLAEGRLTSVPDGSFGGSGEARTLPFDFSAQRVPIDRVQTVFVSIFQ